VRSQGRREFLQGGLALAGLGLLAGCEGLPFRAQQPARIPRIGVLWAGPQPFYEAFRTGLRDLGYVEGQNVVLEYRDAEGKAELIADLTAELIRLPVDVIVAAPAGVARGARQLTETLPIVVAYGDPVTQGLVVSLAVSLARPGGNVTGLTAATAELSGKRLQLLQEALPGVSRVAVLGQTGSGSTSTGQFIKETEAAALALGLQLQVLGIGDPSEFESAFSAMRAEHAEALVVTPGSIISAGASAIIDLATRWRLPTIFESRLFADRGALMAYGPSLTDLARRSATYVDKILKGTKPGDLPVEGPTRFDFVINLQTAQALGLTIPQSVLQQATEVIQ
jgi:putative tryptophan/tyrosine transport system substrate-binding protein